MSCSSYPFYGARRWSVIYAARACASVVDRSSSGLQAIYRRALRQRSAPEHRVVPLSAQRLDDRAGERCLVRRHHLHPMRSGFLYLVAIMALGQPACAGFETVEHPGLRASERARRGAGPPWHAGDLQYRPGFMASSPASPSAGSCGRSGPDLDHGRGRYLDNIFIERLWRSLKYEDRLSRRARRRPFEAQPLIGEWIDFYNDPRGRRGENAGVGLPVRAPRPVDIGGEAATRLAHAWAPPDRKTTARR